MEEKILKTIVYLYDSNCEIKFSLNNKHILQIILKLAKENKIRIIRQDKNFITVKPHFFYLKSI